MPKVEARVRLTKREVDNLQAQGRERLVWDAEVPGFGIRAYPNGRKLFVFQYFIKGRTRRMTLGTAQALTSEQARERVRGLRQQVQDGRDPARERQQARHAETVSVFCNRYLTQHAERHKKESSVKDDRMLIRKYVRPELGSLQVAEVTRADVIKLHQSMSSTPYVANRAVALLSKMMNLAEKWGVRPDGTNPCRHVERYREQRRQRFLSSLELAKLGKVLADIEKESVEHRSVVPAIRLLILTGARRGEILGLEWSHVVWDRECLDLPDSKTGPKTIHLNPAARQVLKVLSDNRPDDSPWVIRGRVKGQPFVGLPHVWQRIRKRAELDDVRLHDLRHSFASVAAASGSSLPIIGALLGHTQPATTQRYAHLAADPLKEATARVGERIVAMMKPKRKRAQVIGLKQSRVAGTAKAR